MEDQDETPIQTENRTDEIDVTETDFIFTQSASVGEIAFDFVRMGAHRTDIGKNQGETRPFRQHQMAAWISISANDHPTVENEVLSLRLPI